MSTQAVGGRRPGWLTFAAILMFAVALARIVSAINLFSGGDQVSDLTHSLFGDQLWAWGIWDLVVSALALFAGFSLLTGGGYGRFVAYVWAIVVIFNGLVILTAAPWYAATAIAIAVLVIYGIAASSDWSEEV
jgi:hypothetical protein